MISFLSGEIILKSEKYIVLDVKGVGYKVFLSQRALLKLPEIGASFKCFCYLNVRENALDLYGFLTKEELNFFEMLDSIHGVGPKAALEISSLGSLEKIKERILAQDEKLFDGIPGIGRKKAVAIILELTGEVKKIETGRQAHQKPETSEAEQALINLGFSRQQAKEALSRVPKEIRDTESRVKEALKLLGK